MMFDAEMVSFGAKSDWGTGGREFKSPRSDQFFQELSILVSRCSDEPCLTGVSV